jgi:hypothetical protein
MATGEGLIGYLAQTVTRSGEGLIGRLAQTVETRITGSGIIGRLAQTVEASGEGLIGSLAQTVRNQEHEYKFKQNPGVGNIAAFDLQVIIGAQIIDIGMLVGQLTITRNEGDAALCSLQLKPPHGDIDLDQWHGKSILVNCITATTTHRIYTGAVDIPEIDLEFGRITLRCTDKRTERNNALSPVFVQSMGYWSDDLFGEPDDINAELNNRLETIPYSWDYDADGTGYLAAWEPKATADYTFSDASIYRRNPTVTVLSRGRVKNKITFELEFQYQRLRQRNINYTFDSELSACLYSAWGLPPTAVQLKQAAASAGWTVGNFLYEGLDPSGRYSCSGTTLYWTAVKKVGVLTSSLDENGDAVTDQNNNQVFSSSSSSVSWVNVYAQKASWTASKRWAQTISETISLVVSAPQSIAQYGLVESDISVGVASDYDTTAWEDYTVHKSIPTNSTVSANGDYIYDKVNDDIAAYKAAAYAGIAKARTEIIKAHRDNRVTIETPFFPQVDLRHTVATTAGKIRCKGKVSSLVHTIDLFERWCATEIEISLSRSTGTATDSGLSLPARPAVTDASSGAITINLKTHTVPIGGVQNSTWNGYIFKRLIKNQRGNSNGARIPIATIIDTPDIDDASRDTKDVSRTATNIVAIRNDLLEITFDGK